MARAIGVTSYLDRNKVIPVKTADKPRDQAKRESFFSILKRQANEDVPTFVLTRLSGLLLVLTIAAQSGIALGWIKP